MSCDHYQQPHGEARHLPGGFTQGTAAVLAPGRGCDGFDGVKGCLCSVTVERHGVCPVNFCISMYGLQQ